MRIVVYHTSYGCETGCCGHYCIVDGDEDFPMKTFQFEHPYGRDKLQFAKQMIREAFGEEHVADLDWENSFITDAC